jgi:hypothetical protein
MAEIHRCPARFRCGRVEAPFRVALLIWARLRSAQRTEALPRSPFMLRNRACSIALECNVVTRSEDGARIWPALPAGWHMATPTGDLKGGTMRRQGWVSTDVPREVTNRG